MTHKPALALIAAALCSPLLMADKPAKIADADIPKVSGKDLVFLIPQQGMEYFSRIIIIIKAPFIQAPRSLSNIQ